MNLKRRHLLHLNFGMKAADFVRSLWRFVLYLLRVNLLSCAEVFAGFSAQNSQVAGHSVGFELHSGSAAATDSFFVVRAVSQCGRKFLTFAVRDSIHDKFLLM